MTTELDRLREEFADGKYTSIPGDLEAFIEKNRPGIRRFRDEVLGRMPGVVPTDALAIKWYVLQIRSINPVHEIKEELGEIEQEIWIQGEQNRRTPDRLKVAREWCARHAPGWRDHRVLAIIYVLERDLDRYVDILNREPNGPGEKAAG